MYEECSWIVNKMHNMDAIVLMCDNESLWHFAKLSMPLNDLFLKIEDGKHLADSRNTHTCNAIFKKLRQVKSNKFCYLPTNFTWFKLFYYR